MYLIDGPISKKTHFNTVEKDAILALQKKHKANELDGEELFWTYHKWIIEDVKYPDKEWDVIWKKLTRAQKTIFVLGIFISQTNNGGVWQFLFNRPEYSGAAGEAFHAISPMLLWNYQSVFEEFAAMVNNGDFWPVKNQFSDESIPFDQRWAAFKKAGDEIPSAEKVDNEFYTKEFKERFYREVNAHIEQNLGKMLGIISDDEKPVIKKKDAIPNFSEYLKKAYGVEPEEVAVYYTGRVTIENTSTNLFLMKFKMPDGYESLGITGYFTHHFPDLPFSEVKSMHQRHHKQKLVNLYHGWYLVEKELDRNPKANKFNPKEWEKFVAEIQSPEKTQIPVNIKFRERMKIGKSNWFIYDGDLLYNKPSAPPDDYENVKITRTSSEIGGEINLTFFTENASDGNFGGRSARDSSVEGKYRLYACVGSMNKLLKDNPWGF